MGTTIIVCWLGDKLMNPRSVKPMMRDLRLSFERITSQFATNWDMQLYIVLVLEPIESGRLQNEPEGTSGIMTENNGTD